MCQGWTRDGCGQAVSVRENERVADKRWLLAVLVHDHDDGNSWPLTGMCCSHAAWDPMLSIQCEHGQESAL